MHGEGICVSKFYCIVAYMLGLENWVQISFIVSILKKCSVLARNFLGLVQSNNKKAPVSVSFKLSYMLKLALSVFELLLLLTTC